ncbi:glycosyltransferase family 2 protein [Haloarcula marina]|uniref:glycosyltransferase family 2 protein n=1 Tax=Haloarcula marina TaxID=2961574 RepID=UPI0020B65314|nr:glycosyltransferase family 2 protein [Halomicroarcula marina]
MSGPLVSVVTPSYEQAEFLEDNLRSVMEQTGPSVEHVVVDGGSTDGSVDILESYEDEYDLRWVSEPDDGQSDALNKGIEMATGRWLCWVNSDDYLLPGALEAFAEARRQNADCDVIYGDFVFVDAEGREIGRKYNTCPSRFVHKHYYQFTGNHSTFFRRGVLESVGGIDESLHYTMDTELFWRLLEADLEMTHVPGFLGARRLHEAAKTTGEPPAERLAEIRALKSGYDYTALERALPDKLLTAVAVALQGTYHTLDGRPEAIRHMLS